MSTEFKKLEAGDTIRIIGEPVLYRRHFVGKSVGSAGCAKQELTCPFCKENAEYNERERLKAEGAVK